MDQAEPAEGELKRGLARSINTQGKNKANILHQTNLANKADLLYGITVNDSARVVGNLEPER